MSSTLQLCETFQVIFTLSQPATVPQVWKYATIVPVDFRPVTLTFPVMKLIKLEILKQVDGRLTFSHLCLPLGQVEGLSMQQTGTFLIQYLEAPRTYIRHLFIDLSWHSMLFLYLMRKWNAWMNEECLFKPCIWLFGIYKECILSICCSPLSLYERDWGTKPTAKRQKIGCVNSRSGKKIWKWTFLYLTFSLLCIGLSILLWNCFLQNIVVVVFSLPGKQLFEKDHNLDTSDIQFLEDGNIFYYQFFSVFIHPISKGY